MIPSSRCIALRICGTRVCRPCARLRLKMRRSSAMLVWVRIVLGDSCLYGPRPPVAHRPLRLAADRTHTFAPRAWAWPVRPPARPQPDVSKRDARGKMICNNL
eukprot:scaffold3560_cov124-Isochrysis_galbana.AAC.7